jgi:hypothetical protein
MVGENGPELFVPSTAGRILNEHQMGGSGSGGAGPALNFVYNIASGVNTYNQEIADSLRSFGVDIKFTRPGEQMQLPRCNIDHLIEWGVKPANTLLTLQNFVRNLAA